MSSLGKAIRLNRIFRHPSKRILAIAVDHMINYPTAMPEGLRRIEDTIQKIVESDPSSLTMNKGTAIRCMPKFAGRVPVIIQQMALTAGREGFADHVEVEEAVALGADAIAVAMFVKCADELSFIKRLATTVREAEQFGLPVIPHIYPIVEKGHEHVVSTDPEDVFYAARVGFEMGADVVKIPYTGDVKSFADIVSLTPLPVVIAGGPKCDTLDEAVAMVRDAVKSGAAGTTIGRNVWGFSDIPEAIARLKSALYGDEA